MADTMMACPVCEARDVELFATAYDKEYLTSDEPYRYLNCNSCTAVYLESPPADRLAEIYPENYYSYGEVQETTTVTERVKSWLDGRMLRRVLNRVPGEKLRVLDVGGGSGWLLTTARQVCGRITETHEVDLQSGAEALAGEAGHVYHRMSIEEFESDEPFDLIMMFSIIEHVPDPAAVLRKMTGLLSDGGILLLKTPNTATLDCRLFKDRNWGGFHCPRHFVLFTLPGLRELGERCGLRVVDSYYTQGAPQWAISVMAWLQDKGWIKVSADRPAYQNRVYEPLTAAFAAVDFVRAPFAPTAQMMVSFRRGAR